MRVERPCISLILAILHLNSINKQMEQLDSTVLTKNIAAQLELNSVL